MSRYKISFNKNNQKITKNIPTKAEIASIGQNFDKNNIQYEAKEYSKDKETNRFGWKSFKPSSFCQICGRHLTDPKSINRGIGPECFKKNRLNSEFPETDTTTKILNGLTAKKILESISEDKRNKCRFCDGELDDIVRYYEHNEGWYVSELNNKVWLWIECIKCGHQWSLMHLGVSRNIKF
ncbi:MAG TPA: DUF6011 domain-containing protein [Candidatus Lokiarchaeia archaeon]